MSLSYHHDRHPRADALRALYAASPLRRPIGEPARIARMFEHSNVVLTAYDGERLVGVLRGWTDFAFDGYICDLGIHPGYQKQGVGKRLLEEATALSPEIRWVLLASPIAKDYYGHLGWELLPNAWLWPRAGGAMPDYASYQAEFAELAAKA